MEVANIDQWPEFRAEKYQLPNIVYHKGNYSLDSSAQLTSIRNQETQTYRSRIFWDYLPRDPPEPASQALPSAKNITSMSYIGGRHQHPSLRWKLKIVSVIKSTSTNHRLENI